MKIHNTRSFCGKRTAVSICNFWNLEMPNVPLTSKVGSRPKRKHATVEKENGLKMNDRYV